MNQAFNEAQMVPTVIHFHHAWLVWLVFYVGLFLHAALQIDDISRKIGKRRRDVASSLAIRILFRMAVCSAIFGIVFADPAMIGQIAKLIGHPLSPDELSVFTLPLNNALALIYGLFLDSTVGYVPVLKSQLPQLDLLTKQAVQASPVDVLAKP